MALQVYYLLLNHLVLVSFLNSYCFCKQLVALDLEKDRLERWSAPHEKVGQPTIVNVDSLHTILAILKSSSFPTAVGNISNQQCVEDSLLYVHSLYNVTAGARWARQMHESSAGLPLGMFGSGNVHADGLFDECLAIREPEDERFKGKYCTVFLSTAPVDPSEVLPMSSMDGKANLVTIFQLINQIVGGMILESGRVEPKLSVNKAGAFTYLLPSVSFCLPSSCSADDLGQSVAQLVGTFVISEDPLTSILTTVDEGYCFTDDPVRPSFDGPEIAVIIFLGLLGFLVVSATLHESLQMYRNSSVEPKGFAKVLCCFSALNNCQKILSMKVNPSSDNLGCVHGIRVISTTWVVMGHTWVALRSYIHNANDLLRDGEAGWLQGIGNAYVSVDTFLLISGLLVSYLLLKELDKTKGRFNVGLFYLHRYLRLTPVYAVILGFYATFLVYASTGPNWFTITELSNDCRVAWWKHLLYIRNLFAAESSCMRHTWYMDVDMQLFLVSPLFIYLLWRWAVPGLLFLISTTLASLGACFTVYAFFGLMPTLMASRPKDMSVSRDDFFEYYYTVPWTRAPPYLIGIFLGWFLHVTKQSAYKPSKSLIFLGWTMSLSAGLVVVYGLVPYLDVEKVPTINPAISLTYGPLHRAAWALAIGWVVWACVRGYGGFVNRFLSWKIFMPLSRLTYCVYLIHYDYLNVFFSTNRKLLYYTFYTTLTSIYFGVLLTSFGLSFIVVLTVEAPFLNLEKLLFTSRKKTPHAASAP